MKKVISTNRDFDQAGSWKGEMVYAIGVSGVAPITARFDFD